MFLPIDFSENMLIPYIEKKSVFFHAAIDLQLFAEVNIWWDKELSYTKI